MLTRQFFPRPDVLAAAHAFAARPAPPAHEEIPREALRVVLENRTEKAIAFAVGWGQEVVGSGGVAAGEKRSVDVMVARAPRTAGALTILDDGGLLVESITLAGWSLMVGEGPVLAAQFAPRFPLPELGTRSRFQRDMEELMGLAAELIRMAQGGAG